jgi:hypothetical protein
MLKEEAKVKFAVRSLDGFSTDELGNRTGARADLLSNLLHRLAGK